MNGARIILLFAVAGGVFAAYRYGYLDEIAAKLGLPAQGGALPKVPEHDDPLIPVVDDDDDGDKDAMNQWEERLVRQQYYVSPWAWTNRRWAAAIMKTESGSIGPGAVGSAGEIGLYQVKPGTAEQMYREGYTRFPATAATLKTEAGGIYFGTAYMDYLSKINSNRDWITKAYNGGPGWEGLGASYRGAREEYLRKVYANYDALYLKGTV